jgi:AcrR family transcriptional regulator
MVGAGVEPAAAWRRTGLRFAVAIAYVSLTNDETHHPMSTARADPVARTEPTRERIAAVAERLFRAMGYQKTAVADIARELGMSPANVYRFYPSKSAINEAIAARLLGGMERGAWEIARGPGGAADRLRRLFRYLHEQHVALFFEERRLHDMVTAAMAEHWGVIERFIRSVQDAIRHVLEDGIAAGEFARLDPDQTALTIRHALLAWNHPVLIADCVGRTMTEAELAAQLEQMTGFILRALRP